MRTLKNWYSEWQSEKEQKESGRLSRGRVVANANLRMEIQAGNHDEVSVYRDPGVFYVLSVHPGLGRVIFETFDKSGHKTGEVYLRKAEEAFGPDWEKWKKITLARKCAAMIERK